MFEEKIISIKNEINDYNKKNEELNLLLIELEVIEKINECSEKFEKALKEYSKNEEYEGEDGTKYEKEYADNINEILKNTNLTLKDIIIKDNDISEDLEKLKKIIEYTTLYDSIINKSDSVTCTKTFYAYAIFSIVKNNNIYREWEEDFLEYVDEIKNNNIYDKLNKIDIIEKPIIEKFVIINGKEIKASNVLCGINQFLENDDALRDYELDCDYETAQALVDIGLVSNYTGTRMANLYKAKDIEGLKCLYNKIVNQYYYSTKEKFKKNDDRIGMTMRDIKIGMLFQFNKNNYMKIKEQKIMSCCHEEIKNCINVTTGEMEYINELTCVRTSNLQR